MSRGHRAGHHQPVEETLAQLAISQVDQLTALLANAVQQLAPAGTLVAAGTAITADASLTLLPGSTKFRISASTSFTSGAGTVRPFLQVAITPPGGPPGVFLTVYSWGTTSDTAGSASVVLRSTGLLLPPIAPGSMISVHWQTTAGDATATLGNVAAGVAPPNEGAALIIEQVP